LRAQPPVVVLLAGLQGAGKTTTAGKLARWLIEGHKKRVLLVSTDIRRPPPCCSCSASPSRWTRDSFPTDGKQSPRTSRAMRSSGAQGVYDVLIVDTAGRCTSTPSSWKR
jgi:signal recognition particle subunit SRP54